MPTSQALHRTESAPRKYIAFSYIFTLAHQFSNLQSIYDFLHRWHEVCSYLFFRKLTVFNDMSTTDDYLSYEEH